MPAVGEMLGQMPLEEIVGESVDVEHRALGTRRGLATGGDVAYQGGNRLPLTVGIGAEIQGALLVIGAEDIGLPVGGAGAGAGIDRGLVRHHLNLSDTPAAGERPPCRAGATTRREESLSHSPGSLLVCAVVRCTIGGR